MYQYWGFGLHINSEIEFPELMPCSFDNADLVISIGKAPKELQGEDVVRKVRLMVSPTKYLIDIDNIARYYAADGGKIIIDPYERAEMESIRLFTLSNAVAAILHQQKKIPLHASGIIMEDGLILFTGPSGIGKSTTVFGLMNQGYQLFTDDICVLTYVADSNSIEGTASYPMLKLWQNTLDELAISNIDRSYKVRSQLPKYGVFQHRHFSKKSIPIKDIYILKTDNRIEALECSQLNKTDAFSALQQNTYRRSQIDMMQLRQHHFDIISRVVNQARVFELSKPQDTSGIHHYIDFIKQQLINNA